MASVGFGFGDVEGRWMRFVDGDVLEGSGVFMWWYVVVYNRVFYVVFCDGLVKIVVSFI